MPSHDPPTAPTEAVTTGDTRPAPAAPPADNTATGKIITGLVRLKPGKLTKFRNIELRLLLLAFVINAAAILLVQLGVNGQIDGNLFTFGVIPAGLILIMHVVLRVSAPEADPFLLPVATLLNGLGIAMLYRLDLAEGYAGWEMSSLRQVTWAALALVLALVVLLVIRNHRLLQRYTYVSMFLSVVLLILPLVPGLRRGGDAADIWISIGAFNFQPAEAAKITLAIFFASYLASRRDSLSFGGTKILGITFPRVRDLGPIIVIWLAAMGVLIFQRDLGTSLLYFGLFLVMMYVATGRWGWVLFGLGLFIGGAFLASRYLGYVQWRFTAWLDAFNPEVYAATGGSYQLVQGIFGMADGGLIGTGWGRGQPDLVPLAENDFIVPSLTEELGLAGLFAILVLYLILVSRGFKIGLAGQDEFGRLLGVGLTFVIALQVFIVIGGVTRLIPLTGLTTPFLASGGSSLVTNWIIVAILLRLSDTIRNQPKLVIQG